MITCEGYELRLSSAPRDPAWDRFLLSTEAGHHPQSSYWGRVKAEHGWRAVRVAVLRGGLLRGGAQILLRGVPLVGSIGYVPLGPVLDSDDPALRALVLQGLHAVSRKLRVLFLVIQPPAEHASVVTDLLDRGFREAGSLIETHPTATVLVDLTKDEDALLAAMRGTTRHNIRLAARKGVTVRQGREQEIPDFHRLLAMTGKRQGFPIPSVDYFMAMMRIMAPDGHARIFIAEFQGEPVSAALVVAFGDRVSYKRGAWSGLHRQVRPNDFLHWTIMRWAKQAGYRHYDMEGIDPADARAVLAGGRPAVADGRSVSWFKLGFGGDVRLMPGPYERIHNPALRGGYHLLVPHLLDSPPARWIINTLRTR